MLPSLHSLPGMEAKGNTDDTHRQPHVTGDPPQGAALRQGSNLNILEPRFR